MNFENQIICGDAREILFQLPLCSVDLVVTSPPYDNLRDYKGYSFDFENIIKGLKNVLKTGGVIVWIVGDATIKGSETGTSFRQALYFMELGFNLHDTMIYQKFGCPFPETNRYYPQFEYMFIFSKGKPKNVNLLKDRKNKRAGERFDGSTDRQPDGTTKPMSFNKTGREPIVKEYGVRWNIWQYQGQRVKGHPAPFPLQLAIDHIKSWSNEGDLILDPMCGSGTTCLAAKQLNRRFIGIEISKEYCMVAEKRLKDV